MPSVVTGAFFRPAFQTAYFPASEQLTEIGRIWRDVMHQPIKLGVGDVRATTIALDEWAKRSGWPVRFPADPHVTKGWLPVHRFTLTFVCFSVLASAVVSHTDAQQAFRTVANSPARDVPAETPLLRKLSVPGPHAQSIATKLGLRYRDVANVTVTADAKNQQLVVMAPQPLQLAIARDVRTLLDGAVAQASAQSLSPFSVQLKNISWRQFERDLAQVGGPTMPVTTSDNGNRAAYQLNVTPMQGTTVEVDRKHNIVTVRGPDPSIPGWRKMISALDSSVASPESATIIHRLENAQPAPIQRAIRLLRSLEDRPSPESQGSAGAGSDAVFRNAVFQTQAGGEGAGAPQGGDAQAGDAGTEAGADGEEGQGAGPLGNVNIQFVPELGQIIITGNAKDVEQVKKLIDEIEAKAVLTQPEIEIVPLKNADCNAVAELLTQLYEDVLSSRQGDVSITSLDSPNSLLLIGRKEAIESLKKLIWKIDQPIEPSSRLRVFRLQNASAVDAEATILGYFSALPAGETGVRPGLGPRVRVLADYRTNSLIVSAAPRDMLEVTRLINELDVQQITAQSELKVFPLRNASAEDLATTLQDSINGTGDAGNENVTPPSTSLSIVAVDSAEERVVDSGILAGATITADVGANAIVVRAPAASMPLIAELIRQLDKAPGIDSLVKVFTMQNGDVEQMLITLETLFGADAATVGTSVGAANAAGLPPLTAAPESSLVPLRFSTDIRTNSIIASGSAEDLEVVESILLRLDSEGFAERITEVVWLRNNDAELIAAAITNYVNERLGSQNSIRQYQQGLGPFDLLDRDIVAIPEVNSNSILLSVSPRLYEEVRGLIDQLDRRRPMVMIKLLIAEVLLDDTFEMGGELGLQDSLVFNRGLAVGDNVRAAGTPGFNFNNAGVNNVNTFGRDTIGAAGVSSFGLGTVSGATNYGGFVLNAASESVSMLFRTLQDANRLQVLSDPEVLTMDNTESQINVGRQIARFRGTTVTNQIATQNIEDITVGLTLQIRPRVGSDGVITVEVDITRSDRDDASGTLVPDGTGNTVIINDIVQTTAQSILSVYNGQTVIMGGLIQKTRSNFSRRVPLIADIPLVGNLFKFEQEFERRSELLLIMTPTIVSSEQDSEYIKQVESSRMSWCLADVVEAHGDVGLNGGYGLWGPAIGPTIYPDVTPTIENEVIVSDVPVGSASHSSVGEPVIMGTTDNNPIGNPPAGDAIFDSTMGQLLETESSVPANVSPPSVIQGTPTPAIESVAPPVATPNSEVLPVPVGSNQTTGMQMPGQVIGQVSATSPLSPSQQSPSQRTQSTLNGRTSDFSSPSQTPPSGAVQQAGAGSSPSWLDAYRGGDYPAPTGPRPTRLSN